MTMTTGALLKPESVEALSRTLAAAHLARTPIGAVDLSGWNRIIEHTPEDMTVTVQAGLTLAGLQSALKRHGQWLPIDPPEPDRLTLRELLDRNASGPRRHGHGTIRDHLIGLRAVLADGRVIKSGGKVVKNVAGYDLLKLFVGAHGSLGVIIEASFKLLPCPETEIILRGRCAGWAEVQVRLDDVLRSALTPVALDLHNLSSDPAQADLVIALAGAAEDVNWQRDLAATLGFAAAPEGLEYDRRFWIRESGPPVHRLSVMPSRLAATLASLGDVSFVARAGCGTVYYRGGHAPGRPDLPRPLLQRVKDAYDPHHILPSAPW